MSDTLKKNLIKYSIAFVICALIGFFYVSQYDFASLALVDKYRILCDAFSLPGMLMILFAGLMWVMGKGTLDAVGFILRRTVYSLIPGKRLEADERYTDYVERQRSKKQGDFRYLYIVGAVCIAFSLIFLVLFNTAR